MNKSADPTSVLRLRICFQSWLRGVGTWMIQTEATCLWMRFGVVKELAGPLLLGSWWNCWWWSW